MMNRKSKREWDKRRLAGFNHTDWYAKTGLGVLSQTRF